MPAGWTGNYKARQGGGAGAAAGAGGGSQMLAGVPHFLFMLIEPSRQRLGGSQVRCAERLHVSRAHACLNCARRTGKL